MNEDIPQQKFIDDMTDIVSSGYGWSGWHEDQLTVLFDTIGNETLANWLEAFYNQPYGVEEGVTGIELNFIAKYLGKTVQVVIV